MGSLSDDIYMKEPTRKEMEEYNHREKVTVKTFKLALAITVPGEILDDVLKDLDILLEKEHEKGAQHQLNELRRLSIKHLQEIIGK